MSEAYRSIAIIQKTHGRNGEVVAVAAHGLPLALREGLCVYPVPPELKGPRRLVVASCSGDASGQLVSFAGVDNLNAASGLVGKTLLARRADLPHELLLRDVDALLGREVQDVRLGSLGTIEEVMRGPANDVWVVRGPYGEVLVPAVDAIVRDLDRPAAQGGVLVEVPNGLVDEREAGR